MRKIIVLLVMIAALVSNIGVSSASQDWRWERCKFKNLDSKPSWSTREIARTIECMVDQFPVPGGVSKALDVGRCESGLDAYEYGNPPYMGVYQFHPSTWSSAYDHHRNFLDRWGVKNSPFNGRSNVLLAIKMVHSGGWGPWSCA